MPSVARRASAIALLISVAYLAVAVTPCPAPVTAGLLADVGHAVHNELDPDDWCSISANATFLSAVCPCGCDERPALVGARAGVGMLASAARTSAVPDLVDRLISVDPPRAPATPVRSIDHVPLPA
jgi:hypothetical protein